MPKTRTAAVISLQEFIDRLASKNKELLLAFVLGLRNGELSLDLEEADAFIDAVIDEWCETEEPNRELHLRMISAVYLWMILDEIYAEDLTTEPAGVAEEGPIDEVKRRVDKAAKVSVEVVRTVQAVWGIIHG
jgi:hypothetical protein